VVLAAGGVVIWAMSRSSPKVAQKLEDEEVREAAEQGRQERETTGQGFKKEKDSKQDDQGPIARLRKAAEQGEAAAQYHLGVQYANGRGVRKNEKEAAHWYRKALSKGDASTRERSAAALARLGPQAAPALQELTEGLGHTSPAVRRNCCIALAGLGAGAKSAIPALVEALKPVKDAPTDPAGNRPYEEVREQAAEAIARIGAPNNLEAIPVIRTALATEKNQAVRQRYVWALFRLKELDKHDLTGVLAKVLQEMGNESLMVRYDCARVLAFGLRDRAPDRTIDTLLHALNNTNLRTLENGIPGPVGSGRFMAAQALGWLGDKAKKNDKVVAALRAAAKDKDSQLRQAAQQSLKNLGLDPVPESLPTGTEDSKQDDQGPIARLRKAAEQGEAAAQYHLGVQYANGRGVRKDDLDAARWLRKAADQGHALAQKKLKELVAAGRAVEKVEQEIRQLRASAEEGDIQNQAHLGDRYRQGTGVKKDEKEAARWYRKAALNGHANAMTCLGVMYADGLGVKKDEKEAVKWYRKAADKGSTLAMKNLGLMYERGRGVAKDLNTAVEWYRKAAEQKLAEAQYYLGQMYEGGRGVPRDPKEAREWYEKAAAQGHPGARDRLDKLDKAKPGPLAKDRPVAGQDNDKGKPKGKDWKIVPGYKREKIRGFTLMIHRDVHKNNDDSKWRRKPLDVIDLELATICRNLPDRAVKALQLILLWIEWEDTNDPDLKNKVVAKYYGVQGNLALWSLGKGKHPGKANNIEVINMKALTAEHQPGVKFHRCVLLHELAHAVHHQLFGSSNAQIKVAYQQAMARKLYAKTKDVYGRTHEPAYAAKNEREYFAELSCAYLDRLHYHPSTPDDLKKHDPVGYKLMEGCWGTRKRLDRARDAKAEKEASGLLAAARKLYGTGKKREGVTLLARVVDQFEKTKAGGEAKKLLRPWKKELGEE
jgi:TPR repeat protein